MSCMARQSHQPASGKPPLPHHPLIRQLPPTPPTPPVGFPFDWQRPCYFRLDCLTAPLPGLIMLGLFSDHSDPRKALSDCPTDRDQISSTCLPCWLRREGVYTQQSWCLIDWPGSWAEDCPSARQWWKMESASPPSLINAPLCSDSIKQGVRKHRACCHCSGVLGTGFQLQLGAFSFHFYCPLLSPSLLL